MRREAEELFCLFAEKISDLYVVTDCSPDRARMTVEKDGVTSVLHVDERDLVRSLEGADDLGEQVWGEALPAVESVARLMTVHLDESLATRDPHPTRRWSYRRSGFDPLPPWEADGPSGA